MKKNKLAFKLIDMGLKAETLANLTESQLRLLYNKLNEGKKETKEVSITKTYEPNDKLTAKQAVNIKNDPNAKITPDGGITTTYKDETNEAKKKSSKKKYNPWAICTASVGREDKKKYEKCVMDVKKSIKEGKDPVNLFLEEKIVSLLEKHIQPKISKKEFLQMISETETAPAKPNPKAKSKRETNEQETAEPIVKPKTPTTKPKTPFSPKPGVNPRPKAGKKSVPTWLKWDNLGLNF